MIATDLTLTDWFALIRETYQEARKPIHPGDPRGQVLADDHFGPTHRTDDPDRLGAHYWEYVASNKLPLPPIAWPSWSTDYTATADAWGGGTVEVLAQGSTSVEGVSLLFMQRFVCNPDTATVTAERASVCITTPDSEDEMWVFREHLPALADAVTRARSVLDITD